MIQQEKNAPPPGITLNDVLLVLVRRKWLVLAFAIVGVVVAALFYIRAGAQYSSEAKLFIRYVLEKKLPAGGNETQIRQPDASGRNIVGSEVEVLTSYDLAIEVAEKVGPQKLFEPDSGFTPTKQDAAALISGGLKVDVAKNSDVVRISFHHADPTVVQPVLSQLISSYLRKHDEIHRASGVFDEVLTQQTDALRSQVAQTEEDLRKLRLKTGISNLEDTKKAYTEELSRVRQEVNNTMAEMAERQASFAAMQSSQRKHTISEPATNMPAVDSQATAAYKSVVTRLDALRKREQDYLKQFTPGSSLVRDVRLQIAECEQEQKGLESEHPGLAGSEASIISTSGGGATTAFDPAVESARIAALQAKWDMQQKVLERLNAEIKAVNEAEPELLRLQRKKEIEETQYRHFLGSLEQARFDEALGTGRLSNIGVAQTPSPAFRESTKVLKVTGMIAFAGLAIGLALAFGLEMYLRPVIKTPGELERKARHPVFISIPATTSNGRAPRGAMGSDRTVTESGAARSANESGREIVAWDPGNRLQAYYEGLRDRLMTWFDAQNLTRKPKLVAVTSCHHGAGVSNIAAGLAATLSETGDGRVLLVDMNVGQGAAHSFYKGRPSLGLDEALESEGRDDAQISENLFVVSEGSPNRDKLPSVLPRRFKALVPKLKASDFDYIIFDMPPVSPITMTPRLSGYMDMVLLVVESEKTSHDALKKANQLLADARANVGAVLNKTKPPGPEWLGLTS